MRFQNSGGGRALASLGPCLVWFSLWAMTVLLLLSDARTLLPSHLPWTGPRAVCNDSLCHAIPTCGAVACLLSHSTPDPTRPRHQSHRHCNRWIAVDRTIVHPDLKGRAHPRGGWAERQCWCLHRFSAQVGPHAASAHHPLDIKFTIPTNTLTLRSLVVAKSRSTSEKSEWGVGAAPRGSHAMRRGGHRGAASPYRENERTRGHWEGGVRTCILKIWDARGPLDGVFVP